MYKRPPKQIQNMQFNCIAVFPPQREILLVVLQIHT